MTSDVYDDCPVCLVPLARDNRWRALRCDGHWLHRECWDSLVRTAPVPLCPMCRESASSIICAHSRKVHNYIDRRAVDDARMMSRTPDSTIGFAWTMTILVHLVIGYLAVMTVFAQIPGLFKLLAIGRSMLIDATVEFIDMIANDVCTANSSLREFIADAINLVSVFVLGYGYIVAISRIARKPVERI